MPTYAYRCEVCGADVVLRVSHADADRERYCGAVSSADATYWGLCRGQLIRQPSAPTFIIKGFSAKNGYSAD